MTEDLAALKARAAAQPNGPDALRLTWRMARAIGASRSRLLELIRHCRERSFSVPEIDSYVAEELARARAALDETRQRGRVVGEALEALEHALELGELAERARQDLAIHPAIVEKP
jgi:hypothetical protein